MLWEYKQLLDDGKLSTTAILRDIFRKRKRLYINIDNQPFSKFDGKEIHSFHHMFDGCDIEEIIFEDNVKTDHIWNVRCMFRNCFKLKYIKLPKNAFPNVKDISYMFESCPCLEKIEAKNALKNEKTNEIGKFITDISQCEEIFNCTAKIKGDIINFLICKSRCLK